ncbi:MAG: radical SAM protein [Candidatus Wallbacteria bacterium]|nr:radical SAM protein [Candidatus Wallbacteria bacterium]
MKWSRFNFMFESEKHGPLLYNSRTNAFAELDRESYEKLVRIRENPDACRFETEKDQRMLSMLKEGRILIEDSEDELVELKLLTASARSGRNHLGLTIAPTTDCNFCCPYCYEKRPQVYMTDGTEERLAEFVKDSRARSVSVTWYGGEPLLAFDRIVRLTARFLQLDADYSAGMVTNGYLLDDTVISRLDELKINHIQVTIDGPEEIHNQRRRHVERDDSFRVIMKNLDSLMSSTWKGRISIRVNVDNSTKEYYPQIVSLLRERFHPNDRMHIYPGIVTDTHGACASVESTCFNKEDEARFELECCQKHGLDSVSLYPSLNPYSCQANTFNSYVVGPEGELYKCWNDVGNKEKAVGTVYKGVKWNMQLLARYLVGTDAFSDEKCQKCFFLPICAGGCAYIRLKNKYEGTCFDSCIKYKKFLRQYLEAHYEKKKAGVEQKN